MLIDSIESALASDPLTTVIEIIRQPEGIIMIQFYKYEERPELKELHLGLTLNVRIAHQLSKLIGDLVWAHLMGDEHYSAETKKPDSTDRLAMEYIYPAAETTAQGEAKVLLELVIGETEAEVFLSDQATRRLAHCLQNLRDFETDEGAATGAKEGHIKSHPSQSEVRRSGKTMPSVSQRLPVERLLKRKIARDRTAS